MKFSESKYAKPSKHWLMYPDDGGLKEPVRDYDETFSVVDLYHIEVFKVTTKQAMDHRLKRCDQKRCKMCRWKARYQKE